MTTVAILGGGISGLSCAYYLKSLGGSKIKYIFLLEKNKKFGGLIQTTRFPDGALCEHGPRSLRSGTKSGYNAIALAERLGLESRIVTVTKRNPHARKNFVLSNGELHPLFGGIFKATPPYKHSLLQYLVHDLMTKKSTLDDETVYDFGLRRGGKDVADFILDPLCRGLTAGDARELSLRSTFPVLFDAENKHGSIIKGLFKSRGTLTPDIMQCSLAKKAFNEGWQMWTFKNGLSELIDTLACAVDKQGVVDLHFNAKCTALKFAQNKAEVVVDDEAIQVDHVFSALPAYSLASLLDSYPLLNKVLSSITYINMAIAYLEFENDVLKMKGFGFLSPSFEESKVLGVTFESCCFPQLNGTSKTRITCMIGGKWFSNILGDINKVTESDILKIALDAAKRHLHITDAPIRYKVVKLEKCIAQYVIGHYKKLITIDDEIAKNNLCLSPIGASYKGLGVPDCIYNSKLSVEAYLKSL